MTGAKECICKGQPLHVLMGAWAQRAKQSVASGVSTGKPASFKELQLEAMLVRKLSEGTSMPFDARYLQRDHHLSECPCSPRFVASGTPQSAQ